MLKLSENPPTINPPAASVRELSGRWWVAHTKSRCEKALAWDLLRDGVSFYLPLMRRTIFSGGRRRHGLMPLFPSYLFIVGDETARLAALQTDRVCAVLPVDDQPRLLDELAAIQLVLDSGEAIDPVPFAAVGRLVRVSRGPFRGLVGRVIRRDHVMRLIMSVSILSRGAEMDIDADTLEPLE